jgi:hypothetical protein
MLFDNLSPHVVIQRRVESLDDTGTVPALDICPSDDQVRPALVEGPLFESSARKERVKIRTHFGFEQSISSRCEKEKGR